MKFYDTDTHEIFEASAAEFKAAIDSYSARLHRDLWIVGCAPIIYMPSGPVLKGHRNFIYKPDEEYVMIKFEDKFVHFRWSDELEGKKCFVADGMEDLRKDFEHGYLKTIESYYAEDYPFKAEPGFYRFAYYDPNYDCKIAFNEGKTIQFRHKHEFKKYDWQDADYPKWLDNCEYRIKPDKPGLTWTDLKLGDTIRQLNGSIVSMVTAFDMAENVTNHVQISGWGWLSDSELAEKWYKV